MWYINQHELVQQYQQDLHNEAKKWRLANQKDEYKPKLSQRRLRRHRRR